jgi:hypothetical protein
MAAFAKSWRRGMGKKPTQAQAQVVEFAVATWHGRGRGKSVALPLIRLAVLLPLSGAARFVCVATRKRLNQIPA